MAYGRNQLLSMTGEELDALFAQSPPGPIPNGDAKGTAILAPGSPGDARIAAFAETLWQGKTFTAATHTLQNRVTLFGAKAIAADVYEGPSIFDDKPCIVIDYSKRSVVAEPVRDEIRLIAPGQYLGRIYWNGKYLGYFALEMRNMAAQLWQRRFQTLLALVIGIPLLIAIVLLMRFLPYRPVNYPNIIDQFKYGSTGGERNAGFPYWIWKALPVVFADRLPQNGRQGYEAFGFVYENDAQGRRRDLPVGVMRGRDLGIDRVFVNCAVCHSTSVRFSPDDKHPKVYVGLGAANMDLGKFEKFLFDIVVDERFSSGVLVPAVEKQAGRLGLIDRYIIYPVAVALMRERLLMLRNRFIILKPEEWGPGRVDTWNSAKAGLNFDIQHLPDAELHGADDFPSIWNQRKRRGMWLHWVGNNDDTDERNLSAAFGTGATPATVDHTQIGRIQNWLLDAEPPPFPFPVDQAKAAKGQLVYARYCQSCHGKSGQDFTGGEYVGQVTPLREIGTDPDNWASYTYDLSASQDALYAGTPYRFHHFRHTGGYTNMPLDGIWLRGPYLHNGSVPTLRDLLDAPDKRPKTFYRGYDVIDPVKVGFVSTVAREGAKTYWLYDTSQRTCSNAGHWWPWSAKLSDADKDDVVEYMKTF
jgi:cytochrome c553